MPVQQANALRLKLPELPAGVVAKVVGSELENVDANGLITLLDRETRGNVRLMVINRLDDSFAIVELEVTIPACTVDVNAPADTEYIATKLAEFSEIPKSGNLENSRTLRSFAESIDRWKFDAAVRKEFDKTIGIVFSLLEKASDKFAGTYLPDQYDFTAASQPAEELYTQAYTILSQILNGKMPFEGLFAEDGANTVDFSLYFDEPTKTYHLFYIRGVAGYMWAERPTSAFGHAISENLVDWTVVQPVLDSSLDGEDDAQVWAPQVVRVNETHYMFYTAVSSVVTQTIKVARSEDLYHWTRVSEIPTIHAAEEWGIWDADKWSDNRDPGVLVDEELGKIFVYYTTQAKGIGFVMAVASCSIDDMTVWTDEGYQVLPQGTATPPESIYVLKKDGKYHMFQTDYALVLLTL